MFVSRPLLGFIGCALLLTGLDRPAWGQSTPRADRAPIEFRLHHVDASASTDVDIWTPVDSRVLLDTQTELTAMRQTLSAAGDSRRSFSDVVLTGFSMLPVVGQFANRDWMKGLVTLGTAAGLTTAIVLGNDRNNPDLVRLGTLGLYPLAVFGTLDAYFTRTQREQPNLPTP